MPTISFEEGSRALPVDFRRCRATSCGDGPSEGLVHGTNQNLPVTAFVHVVDRRPEGDLYIQYWLYYADSATFRDVPVAEGEGYHHDDWESVQVRIGPDGEADERASSHNGYNYSKGVENWASDAGIGPLKELTETVGARAANGWGPETHLLLVPLQPRRQRRTRTPRRPLRPRPPRPPGPAGADRGDRRIPLRGHPALAQGGLERPRGRGDRLTARSQLVTSGH
jgi:hypothetical protein